MKRKKTAPVIKITRVNFRGQVETYDMPVGTEWTFTQTLDVDVMGDIQTKRLTFKIDTRHLA